MGGGLARKKPSLLQGRHPQNIVRSLEKDCRLSCNGKWTVGALGPCEICQQWTVRVCVCVRGFGGGGGCMCQAHRGIVGRATKLQDAHIEP